MPQGGLDRPEPESLAVSLLRLREALRPLSRRGGARDLRFLDPGRGPAAFPRAVPGGLSPVWSPAESPGLAGAGVAGHAAHGGGCGAALPGAVHPARTSCTGPSTPPSTRTRTEPGRAMGRSAGRSFVIPSPTSCARILPLRGATRSGDCRRPCPPTTAWPRSSGSR